MIATVDADGTGFAGETTGFRAGLAVFEECGVGVIEILQLHAWDRLADETFDGENVRGVLGDHDGEGVAGGGGTARAPDAMDVIFGVLWHVVVHHMADVRDVQSARGDVRGDEHFIFAVAESLQSLFAFLLRAVGMQHADGVIVALERVGDAGRHRAWCGRK